jgi:hypothetical protein
MQSANALSGSVIESMVKKKAQDYHQTGRAKKLNVHKKHACKILDLIEVCLNCRTNVSFGVFRFGVFHLPLGI